MRACPFPCKGYRPLREHERPMQEVPVLGREWYRGRVCPGSVVVGDPVVLEVLSDMRAMKNWARGTTLEWFNAQPGWYTAAIQEVQRMQDLVEAEAAKGDGNV